MNRKIGNKIFACAFGPGLNMEMMQLSPMEWPGINKQTTLANVAQAQVI